MASDCFTLTTITEDGTLISGAAAREHTLKKHQGLESMLAKAKEEGREEGLEEGFTAGFDAGHRIGFESGYQAALADAKATQLPEAFAKFLGSRAETDETA